jgi:N6-L-threonylcarbamoyladenine synthase
VADVVLGIETSCDETSAAVLVGGTRGGGDGAAPPELASLIILSQDVHKVFGGVVPELASRAHLAALAPVVDRALAEAGIAWSAVDAVAVTQGPGLVGALLVGVVYAKALAYAGNRRLIGVHHLEGHLFAPAVEDVQLAPPFVATIGCSGPRATTRPARRSTRSPRCWAWGIPAAPRSSAWPGRATRSASPSPGRCVTRASSFRFRG